MVYIRVVGLLILLTLSEFLFAKNSGQIVLSEDDTTAVDSIPFKFFSGAELYLDYGKVLTLLTKFESKYEGGINLRFYGRFVLAGEFGYAVLNPLKAYDNALSYTITGNYFRAGIDYYINLDKKNALYGGLRYGSSHFSDEGEFLLESDFWEDYGESFGSDNLNADWFEIIFGSETRMNIGKSVKEENPRGGLFLGWKARLRILWHFENREEPRVYAIPGYGRTFDKSIPALNLYIKYRFGR